MIVVDTSVLVSFLRGARMPGAVRLEELEREGTPLGIPVVCAQEVLQGARDEREWRLLAGILQGQSILSPADPWATHAEAARIFFDCRRKAISLRGTVDCLIAAMTLEHDAVHLHEDRDFEKMKAVRPLRTVRE